MYTYNVKYKNVNVKIFLYISSFFTMQQGVGQINESISWDEVGSVKLGLLIGIFSFHFKTFGTGYEKKLKDEFHSYQNY